VVLFTSKPFSTKISYWIIGLLFLFASVYVHQKHFKYGIPVSRLDLLHAVMQGNIQIDRYRRNTPDKAVYQGHYYSDKAPGTAFVALPAFAAATAWLKMKDIPLDSPEGWRFSSWVACAGSLGLISALGCVALFAWLLAYVPPRKALIASLALFLGAAPLPYATSMFSHALVIGLIAIGIWAIERQNQATRGAPIQPHANFPSVNRFGQIRRSIALRLNARRYDLLAGFACGLALASEYSAGLVILGIVAWLFFLDRRRLWPFCAGAFLPLFLIPAYSWACFGKPWILPYSLSLSAPMHTGLYSIQWPDPATAYKLLFPPLRGLFFWTPFLLMAGFGYRKLFQTNRRLFWLTAIVPLLQFLVIAGRTGDWTAGPTLGPRYLAPMLPLLALPCAMGVQRQPVLGILLAIYSVALTTFATLTDASPPVHRNAALYSLGVWPAESPSPETYNPLIEYQIPLFLRGNISPNLGTVAGLPPYVSVGGYYFILAAGIAVLWWKLGHPADGGKGLDQDQSTTGKEPG
jgi:hypothetical protein